MNLIDHGISVRGSGDVKTTCPKCSLGRKNQKDPCLSVNIEDGVWNCHHCGWSGSLGTSKYKRPNYNYTKPTVYDWFSKRGIGQAVVDSLKISMAGDKIGFPFFRGDIVCNIKYRTTDKRFSQSKDAEPIFYNLNSLVGSSLGIIVEGEMDVLSLVEVGLTPTISVPMGAPNANDKVASNKLKCLETCHKDIEHVEQWIIFTDNDDNGRRLEYELVRRLGADKCNVVDWSKLPECKDANEILIKHGRQELKMFVTMAKPCPVDGEHRFSEYEDLLDRERRGEPIHKVLDCGWRSFDNYKVAPGYVTTITGVPSSGKSTFAANIAVNMALHHGWKFGMFCPENPGRSMLKKIVTAHGRDSLVEMGDEQYGLSKQFAFDHFYEIIGAEDKLPRTIEQVLSIASVYVKRYGIKGLLIDAYSRLEKDFHQNRNETQYIGTMLDGVSRWAKKHETHVWIVAHPLKMEKDADGKYKVVKPYDISGSSHWFNSSDMILSVYRHLSQEKNQKVTVYTQKVKEEPDFGYVDNRDFIFNQASGTYEEVDYAARQEYRDKEK